jgi:hypothetical protein
LILYKNLTMSNGAKEIHEDFFLGIFLTLKKLCLNSDSSVSPCEEFLKN